MTDVVAIESFNHNGKSVSRGDRLAVSPGIARQLAKSRLVDIVDGPAPPPIHPIPPSGARLSASPVGQASPQTTAILSAAGEALANTPAKRKPGRPRKNAQ